MRIRLGIPMCLLAGCVSQPTYLSPSTSPNAPSATAPPDNAAGGGPVPAVAMAWARFSAASDRLAPTLVIGLEHLPPDERLPILGETRVEPRDPPYEPGSRPQTAPEGPNDVYDTLWMRRARPNPDAVEDPLGREAIHFVSDLVEADRRRVRREVGLPFFDVYSESEALGPALTSELALETDREQWLQEHAAQMLRRPVRQLLRRLPIARELELTFEDFRSDHLPLSEPYREVHGDRRRLGRLSLRLSVDDFADPAEIAYIHSGVRLASSQEFGKTSFHCDLSSRLHVELRARTEYSTGDHDLRADLSFRSSPHTSFHVAVGDDMDFLSTASIYSLFDSPMDGAPGLVLYAVHIF